MRRTTTISRDSGDVSPAPSGPPKNSQWADASAQTRSTAANRSSTVAGVTALLVGCLLLVPVVPAHGQQPRPPGGRGPVGRPPKELPKFGFEDGPMEWVPQDYRDSRACARVGHSDEKAHSGKCALEAVVELVGGDPQKGKGEVWVDLKASPPQGVEAPLDLAGRQVTAWVYVPYGFRGERERPNGYQLFVKDANWKSYYATWKNAVEGQWARLTLRPAPKAPRDGYADREFDPSRIVAIGVKIACGEGSRAKFKGSVYIDDVDW